MSLLGSSQPGVPNSRWKLGSTLSSSSVTKCFKIDIFKTIIGYPNQQLSVGYNIYNLV